MTFSTSTHHKPCDFILFGSQGDLASRKILPALYQLDCAGLLHPQTKITGVGRENLSLLAFQQFVAQCLEQFLPLKMEEVFFQNFAHRLQYMQADLTESRDYSKLKELTQPQELIPIHYLAIPPSLFAQVSQGLGLVNLTTAPARVVLEKPLGHDLNSSQQINNEVSRYFTEKQIYRIDHYLGKETVLNLLALRFANPLISSNWDNQAIDYVQISVAEEVGVENRWAYYNDAGQTRDMVQNHLLQLLALIAMEPPISLQADHIRDEKLKVLKALRPINLSNVQENTVRGQYSSGFINGRPVTGYLEEGGGRGGRIKSPTETFVALKVDIDNWRWSGVPFYLRTGKRMAKKLTEVVITFKNQAHNIFSQQFTKLIPNKLIIRLQPDEGVEIQIMNKIPGLSVGESMQLQQSKLDLSFSEMFKSQRIADAYERLLLEVMLGNQYLFVRRDEIEQAWHWVDGILEAWQNYQEMPAVYQAGTWGPSAAIALLARGGHTWDE